MWLLPTTSFCRISSNAFEDSVTIHYILPLTLRTGSVTHRYKVKRGHPSPRDDLANPYHLLLEHHLLMGPCGLQSQLPSQPHRAVSCLQMCVMLSHMKSPTITGTRLSFTPKLFPECSSPLTWLANFYSCINAQVPPAPQWCLLQLPLANFYSCISTWVPPAPQWCLLQLPQGNLTAPVDCHCPPLTCDLTLTMLGGTSPTLSLPVKLGHSVATAHGVWHTAGTPSMFVL